jgi:hypothetical protein
MEQWWSDTGRGTPTFRREIYLSATFYTSSPTWAGLGSNLGLRDERPANDRLIHGTANTIGDFVLNETGSKVIAGSVRNSLAVRVLEYTSSAAHGGKASSSFRIKCAVTLRRAAVHDRLSVHFLYEICAQSMC